MNIPEAAAVKDWGCGLILLAVVAAIYVLFFWADPEARQKRTDVIDGTPEQTQLLRQIEQNTKATATQQSEERP